MAKVIKSFLVLLVPLFLVGVFFSYRLVEVPPALTVDEAAFGYDGVLLSRTLHDENGKFLPFFVNSIGGKDWRQPVTQYFIALFFKVFSPSTFTLRLTSVVVVLLSTFLLFVLIKLLLGKNLGIIACLLFLTTPIIFIQSHMALDNIMPVPFTILWLLFLVLYARKKKLSYLFLAGVALGINFYSYKAMRGIIPLWTILTVIYLYFLEVKDRKIVKKLLKPFLIFGLGLLPFFAIIPYLKAAYPGAVFAGYRPHPIDWNEFFYIYLANLDPSFLFVKGDSTVYHSTGKHGMMLLASLPLFIVGCYQAVKEKRFWKFVLVLFFLTPLVFSFAGSYYRASRLLSIVPMYVILAGLGAKFLWRAERVIFLGIFLLIFINFSDFVNYYWFTYPKFIQGYVSQTKEDSYKLFANEARKRNLIPYINSDLYKSDGEIAHFFEAAFMARGAIKIGKDEELPKNGILMTYNEKVSGLTRLNLPTPNYYVQVR